MNNSQYTRSWVIRHTRILVASVAFFFGLPLLVYLAATAPEQKKWVEDVLLVGGTKVLVAHKTLDKPYYGGHVFGFGGGVISHEIKFSLDGKSYQWKDLYIPIVLQHNKVGVFLVVFDRETDSRNCRFRFYRLESPDKWHEIQGTEFPKELAVQNMWLKHQNGFRDGKPIDEYQIVEKMNPSDWDFRESLTAKLWVRLEVGLEYYAIGSEGATTEMLEAYNAKYIAKPVTKDPN